MDCLAPLGPVYQAGTLSGNPLAMAAGIEALKSLQDGTVYKHLENIGRALESELRAAAKLAGVPVTFQRIGSMFCGYFTDQAVHNLDDAMKCDRERFGRFFHGMLQEGIYLAPSQFEAGFISAAHTEEDVAKTAEAATKAFQKS